MTWVAAGTSAAGLAASYFGSKNKPTGLPQTFYNQYGELNTPNTGAINSRNSIFGNLNDPGFQSNVMGGADQYAGALRSAAGSPGLASIYQYGMDSLNGNYLQSPIAKKFADQAYTSQIGAGADQAAQTRARFARAGLGFSTGNQQAQDNDMAVAARNAAQARSGILLQNYQQERGRQQEAPGIVSGAISQPLSFLSQIPGAYYSPLNQQGALTAQLTGGSSVSQPNYYQGPSFQDQTAAGLKFGGNLYDAYNSLFLGNRRPGVGAPTTYADFVKNNPTSSAALGG